MLSQLTTALLIASLSAAQTPMATPGAPAQSAAPAAFAASTLTVPAGTAIPLTLVTPIYSRSTKPGDSARATVAFPVMSGSQVAIPAGSYVQGTVSSVTLRDPHTHLPGVQIHFTQLVFANGYSVALDGNSTQAMAAMPESGGQAIGELAFAEAPLAGTEFAPAQVPTQPGPLPQEGPSKGLVFGLVAGIGAGLLVLSLALTHHRRGHEDTMLFASGWQFQMVLAAPLSLNAEQVSAAESSSR